MTLELEITNCRGSSKFINLNIKLTKSFRNGSVRYKLLRIKEHLTYLWNKIARNMYWRIEGNRVKNSRYSKNALHFGCSMIRVLLNFTLK